MVTMVSMASGGCMVYSATILYRICPCRSLRMQPGGILLGQNH